MNVVWAFLIIAAVCAVAIVALAARAQPGTRRRLLRGGDRAAGVFGVSATGFSVLLGFIVFLAFTSYDQSRTGAEQEALILVQQVENAQFLRRSAASWPGSSCVTSDRSSTPSGTPVDPVER